MGFKWEEDEIHHLLICLQAKKPVDLIAKEHQRTVGAINAYRKKLATEFILKKNKTMEETQSLTNLSRKEIEEALCKYSSKTSKSGKPTLTKTVTNTTTTITDDRPTDVITLLKEISHKLDILIEKTGDTTLSLDKITIM